MPFKWLISEGAITNQIYRLNIKPAWIKIPSTLNINNSSVAARSESSACGPQTLL